MIMKLTGGALIYGGETEEKDPYFTKKMQFDEFMKSMYGKEGPPKKEEKSEHEKLKEFVEQVKKRYGG